MKFSAQMMISIFGLLFSLLQGQDGMAQIVINEIHYDPDVPTESVEFIELYNAGTTNADLSGWVVRNAVDYTIPENTSLAAGGYLVIAQDSSAVVTKYHIAVSNVVGPFAGRLANDGDKIELCNPDGTIADEVEYSLGFPWPTVGDPISDSQSGTSYSIQLVNPAFDNDLAGNWRSGTPTPAQMNSVYADNVPPQIRQVHHAPTVPHSGQAEVISAKVSDPDGVASVTLLYQIVKPGDYISLTDSRYETSWEKLGMHDDGQDGDEIAGDFTYTVTVPGDVQQHRRLIRYRIESTDLQGHNLSVPYADDPQPNFAYYCYDGVPVWTGAVRPGITPDVTYSSEMLSSIPVYQLLATKYDVEHCTWLDQRGDNEYHYRGTLVYDGVVYDHVLFRTRGGVWRYSMGKNMWKFNMNRGHAFQGRDNWGRLYKTKWDKVNLGANIQQGDYFHRGEQGMFESVGFQLFNMAGIESSNTNFVHFRIVDEQSEDGKNNTAHSPLTTSGTQYDGDFWGLYLATEQVDGRFLDEHNLPDGNLYKMENGSGEIRNQSPAGVRDGSDLRQFMNGYQKRPADTWWRESTDVSRYYDYRTIVEGIHQYDIADGKNYYYYLNPETQQWFQIPWDLDLTWADNMYGRGDDPFKQAGILQQGSIHIEYQNRMREIRDLLYNPDQTNQLIDEYASFIYNPTGESFVDADRAMWDYHWVMSDDAARQGYTTRSGKAGQGLFYQIASTQDFAGMVQLMKDYVVSRGAWIDSSILNSDSGVPQTPVVQSTGNGFPADSLVFETSDFNDPNAGDSFAAMQWRIAEVEPESVPWDPADSGQSGVPDNYTIFVNNSSDWNYFKGTQEPSDPRDAWRMIGFDDSAWLTGQTPVGYGENILNTTVNDMRNNYTTIYFRKEFTIENLDDVDSLYIAVLFDDGFNLWINGVHVLGENVSEDELPFNGTGQHREDLDYVAYALSDPKSFLVQGTNVIAVQVLNESLGQSSDCFFDAALVGVKDVETPETEPSPSFRHRDMPLKYEINPIWESEEITTFQNQIVIPPGKVTEGHTYRVRVRMKDSAGYWSHWSLPVQFTAEPSSTQVTVKDNLRISEVMYNPAGGNDYEFIELHNTHLTQPLDLGGYAFTGGVTFSFPAGTSIDPNGYLLLTRVSGEAAQAAFRQYYQLDSTISLLGPYEGKLDNAGEKITLKTAEQGEEFIVFEYSDGRGWPLAADGAGHSLVPAASAVDAETGGSLDYGGNWRPSTLIGGSPGTADPDSITGVVINELMANAADGNDWIELYNPTANPIHLGDWYLSDDKSVIQKWPLPAVEIQPGEFKVIDSESGFGASENGFGLSRNGEQILLSYLPGKLGVDRVADAVSFKAQESGWSWGRNGDGGTYWCSMPSSRGTANQPAHVVIGIDEIQYHPASDGSLADDSTAGEYIELYNPAPEAVPLWNANGSWRLDGGVEMIFPANESIPAKGRLLVVPFDPSQAAARDAFVKMYGLDTDVPMAGPYSGSLSNRGERVALEQLLDVDPTDGSLAWALVDELIYFDQAPWTPEADGTGNSLQRISLTKSGNDPANWKAASPTPGKEGAPDTPVASWMMY